MKPWRGWRGLALVVGAALIIAFGLSGCADVCPDVLLKLPHIQGATEAEPIPLYEPETGIARAVDT